MRIFFRKNVGIGMLLGGLAAGCGAPLKRADSTASSFVNVKSIANKVEALCDILSHNSDEPNLLSVSMAEEVCADPTANAQELDSISKDAKDVGFSAVRVTHNDKIMNIETRSEFWLNQTILELLSRLLPELKEKVGTEKKGDGDDEKFTLTVLDEPNFNEATKELSLAVNIFSSREQNGFLNLDNDFDVIFRIFDNHLASAVVKSREEVAFEKSLLHSGKILLLFVPQASDIYLSTITSLNLHSFGADAVVEREILDTVSKGVAALLTKLKG